MQRKAALSVIRHSVTQDIVQAYGVIAGLQEAGASTSLSLKYATDYPSIVIRSIPLPWS